MALSFLVNEIISAYPNLGSTGYIGVISCFHAQLGTQQRIGSWFQFRSYEIYL
jgi:hypothetical protein